MNAVAKTFYIQYRAEQYLLAFSLGAVCLLSVAYVYLLSMSVVHVVASRESEAKVSELRAEIAALESTYMERQHSISMEVVGQKGYISAGDKIFINRDSASVVTRR